MIGNLPDDEKTQRSTPSLPHFENPTPVITLLRELRGLADAPTPDKIVREVEVCLHDVLPLGVHAKVTHTADEDVPPGVVVAVIKTHGAPPSGLLRLSVGWYYGLAGFVLGTACGLFLEALRQAHMVTP